MSEHPRVRFLHSSQGGPVPFTEKELAGPIPLRRPKNNARSSSGLTYGDYLAGVKEFILNNWDRFSPDRA